MSQYQYKVLLLGQGGVGKTTLLSKLFRGNDNNLSSVFLERGDNYVPTLGVEVHPYSFKMGDDTITLNMWECAGDPRYRGLWEGNYHNADGAILVCDPSDFAEFPRPGLPSNLVNSVRGISGEIPLILVANRRQDVRIDVNQFEFPGDKIEVNAKTGENILEPFLMMGQRLYLQSKASEQIQARL